jgi:hypothetical protein
MGVNTYNPIPEGYMSLFDFSRRNNCDLVDLVIAKDLGVIESKEWTLKEWRQGAQNMDTVATIVKADMVPPPFVRHFDYSKYPKDWQQGGNQTRSPYTLSTLGRRMNCSRYTAREWLIRAGLKLETCRNDEEFAAIADTCMRIRAATWAKIREEAKA